MFRAMSRVALATVLGVLAPASLAVPVFAASPSVLVTVTASPSPSVSPGKAVLFIADVAYTGSSTVNHVTAVSSASGATWLRSWVDGVACSSESCSLGTFAGGGDSARLLFLYQADLSGSVVNTVTVTTGEGTNDSSHASHSDTFPGTSPTVGIEQDINFGVATLLPESVDPALATVDTGLTGLGSGNPQGTQLTFPGAAAQGTLATIRDVSQACPASFKSAAKCFGQGSALSVLGGADVVPYLRVTSAWGLSEQRNGVSEKTIQIVHIWDDGTAHVISTICSSTTAPTQLPCRTVGTLTADGTILVTSLLQHNGLIKGW